MKKRIFKSKTRTRLFLLCAITYIPLLLCILLGSEYGKHLLKQQSIRYNHNTISLQLSTVDEQLDHISDYLSSFLLEEENYNRLMAEQPDIDTQLAIQSDLNQYLNTYGGCSSLFFYYPEQDIMILQTANYDSFYERREMGRYIRSICFSKKHPLQELQTTGWSFIQKKNQNYLIEIMEYQNVYAGAWVIGKYAFSGLRELEDSTKGTFILSDREIMKAPLFYPKISPESLTEKSDYVTIPVDSLNNHYQISLCIPEKYVLGAFAWFQYAAIILLVLTMLFLSIQLIGSWRQMVSPVIRMIIAMKAVQKGDFDSHLPVPDTGDEFAELTETFNYMISRIHDLKVQVYEEKLNQVYAELQYLTLQIKPHFFLNCLNLLYSLGLSGRSELVAEFSSVLMKYFRYLFKSSDTMVSVEQETEHIRNYLHIQQIRFQNELISEFSISEDAKNLMIPVLSLHTFVENIFKHAYRDSAQMLIRITARTELQNGETFLLLSIEDNGKGFSDEALEKLNQPSSGMLQGERDSDSREGTHIGIRNVKQRFFRLYGESMVLQFRNPSSGGAAVDMRFPAAAVQGCAFPAQPMRK